MDLCSTLQSTELLLINALMSVRSDNVRLFFSKLFSETYPLMKACGDSMYHCGGIRVLDVEFT